VSSCASGRTVVAGAADRRENTDDMSVTLSPLQGDA
jgi:hypothetical protein